jgi:hypothetical protein
MTALTLPAADALASKWGRLAVSIPGWRWMPGMLGMWSDTRGEVYRPRIDGRTGPWVKFATAGIDPDDHATAGCLLALLGLAMPDWWVSTTVLEDGTHIVRASQWNATRSRVEGRGRTIGRAAIAAAAENGRWPGGGA